MQSLFFFFNGCIGFTSPVFWKHSQNRRGRVATYKRACFVSLNFYLKFHYCFHVLNQYLQSHISPRAYPFIKSHRVELSLPGSLFTTPVKADPPSWLLCQSVLNSCMEIGFCLVFDSFSPQAIEDSWAVFTELECGLSFSVFGWDDCKVVMHY